MTLTVRRFRFTKIAVGATLCALIISACTPQIDPATVITKVEQSELVNVISTNYPEEKEVTIDLLVKAHIAGASDAELTHLRAKIIRNIQKKNNHFLYKLNPSQARQLLRDTSYFYEKILRDKGADVCDKIVQPIPPSAQYLVNSGLADPLHKFQLQTLIFMADARDNPHNNQQPTNIDLQRLGKVAVRKDFDLSIIERATAENSMTCEDSISFFRIFTSLDSNTGSRLIPFYVAKAFKAA